VPPASLRCAAVVLFALHGSLLPSLTQTTNTLFIQFLIVHLEIDYLSSFFSNNSATSSEDAGFCPVINKPSSIAYGDQSPAFE
jgi:hypothetical protein